MLNLRRRWRRSSEREATRRAEDIPFVSKEIGRRSRIVGNVPNPIAPVDWRGGRRVREVGRRIDACARRSHDAGLITLEGRDREVRPPLEVNRRRELQHVQDGDLRGRPFRRVDREVAGLLTVERCAVGRRDQRWRVQRSGQANRGYLGREEVAELTARSRRASAGRTG